MNTQKTLFEYLYILWDLVPDNVKHANSLCAIYDCSRISGGTGRIEDSTWIVVMQHVVQ